SSRRCRGTPSFRRTLPPRGRKSTRCEPRRVRVGPRSSARRSRLRRLARGESRPTRNMSKILRSLRRPRRSLASGQGLHARERRNGGGLMRSWPLVALVALAVGVARAQPPSVSEGASTIGFMHAIHATERLETTLEFYSEVFGLTAEPRAFTNPAVAALTDSPGVSLRIAMLSLPGSGFNFEL